MHEPGPRRPGRRPRSVAPGPADSTFAGGRRWRRGRTWLQGPRLLGVARLVFAILLGAAITTLTPTVSGGRDVADRRPDLRMQPPRDLRVCGSPTAGTFQEEDCPPPAPGDRWLRFGSLIMNVGRGPLELVATRPSTAVDHMNVAQRIRRMDRTWRTVATGATLHWGEEEDGHPHWHLEGLERYRLFRLPEPDPVGALVGVKRGYCVFDGRIVRPDLPRVASRRAYPFEGCGEIGSSQDLLEVRMGLSVGWGDEYAWDYAGQRVPVHAAGDGDYLLCLTADPLGRILERREHDNESWARIRLATTAEEGGERVEVSVLESGVGPCQDEVPYPLGPLTSEDPHEPEQGEDPHEPSASGLSSTAGP